MCNFRYAYWCRQDFDALMNKAGAPADDKERLKIYREIALILKDDPANIPLFAQEDLYATGKSVAGWRPFKDQSLYLAKAYKRD
jgi:ABC-type transport system substrate-binding protein